MTPAEARELCRSLFLETLGSLEVGPRLRKALCLRNGVLEVGGDSYPLSQFQAIRMVSVGKAAIEMAETAAEILGGTKLRGIVVSPSPANTSLQGLEYFRAGHPYPDEQSRRAAEAVLAFLEKCSPDELVLFMISGGGSALLEKPLDPSVSLEDLRRFYEVLVTCGASIEEINILRKHFSAVKGGRLAAQASPAAQITLYVSDVPEDLPSAVASGPTMPDDSTVEDCRRITARYGLLEKFPGSIRTLLESDQLPETPKRGHPSFAQSRYYCLLSNRDGIEKLLELASAKGIHAEADSSPDEWPFQRAADYLLGRLETLRQQHPGRVILLASGGELSSPVPAGAQAGRGGRNQAFVLYCVPKIAGQPVVVLSAGTDGIDGNSPAAGSIADGGSARRAAALGLDPEEFLCRADSYSFFEKLGDTMVTGPTGTNVRDLRILLAYPSTGRVSDA
jgi:glycerate 2-kinase